MQQARLLRVANITEDPVYSNHKGKKNFYNILKVNSESSSKVMGLNECSQVCQKGKLQLNSRGSL